MRLCGSVCALAALLFCSVSPAAEKTAVYQGAKILTAADRVFDPDVLDAIVQHPFQPAFLLLGDLQLGAVLAVENRDDAERVQ